ncbi:hypothetical protein BU23DRAFT_559094, partial [Bimuria novae-zelandiae CBS 107.79]
MDVEGFLVGGDAAGSTTMATLLATPRPRQDAPIKDCAVWLNPGCATGSQRGSENVHCECGQGRGRCSVRRPKEVTVIWIHHLIKDVHICHSGDKICRGGISITPAEWCANRGRFQGWEDRSNLAIGNDSTML